MVSFIERNQNMEEGYAICFNKWALDKRIKNELGLLIIISSLSAEKGYCYANNKYIAEQYNETEQSISNKIKKLEKLNYITIEYKKHGCEIVSRKIRLKNYYIHDITNVIPTIEQKLYRNKHINITNINNIKENNISKDIFKRKYFENEHLNELFIEFLEQRKKLKAINSERAIKQLLSKLELYDDLVKEQMIEESLVNSWKGLFPIKTKKQEKKDEWWKKYEN